ncbi:DEKNAAC100057 [Brettanomyces naardenensis]|uniref:DEKNAAC100057 n=1 Tax=Brettanomyces naardenensis TaxID=13370 RepID=A0A448YFK9_BRENA|nr:DEKNAAC100057 [Brettanomyces naardenensis]
MNKAAKSAKSAKTKHLKRAEHADQQERTEQSGPLSHSKAHPTPSYSTYVSTDRNLPTDLANQRIQSQTNNGIDSRNEAGLPTPHPVRSSRNIRRDTLEITTEVTESDDSPSNRQPLTQINLEKQQSSFQPGGRLHGMFYIKDSPSPETRSASNQIVCPPPADGNVVAPVTTSLFAPHPRVKSPLSEAAVAANHTMLQSSLYSQQQRQKQIPPARDELVHRLQERRGKNAGNAGARSVTVGGSPQSDTQRSQVSLFAPPQQQQHERILFSSSDDSSDDSDWSSLSDDSDFDDGEVKLGQGKSSRDDDLMFQKKEVRSSRYELRSGSSGQSEADLQSSSSQQKVLKKSLLSGLFLDGKRANAPALNTPINQRQRLLQQQRLHQQQLSPPQHVSSPKLVYTSGPDGSHKPSVHHIDEPLDLSLNLSNRATASASTVTTMVPRFSPPENPLSLLKRHSSASVAVTDDKKVDPSSTDNQRAPGVAVVSKSAISLASFLSNSRRPQEVNHYDRFHQSNAPPTATTLLPTALATHMFLPTMSLRQQARARHREPNQIKMAKKGGSSTAFTNSERNTTSSSGGGNQSYAGDGDSEYSSSIKTNTLSIDIPGSAMKHHLRGGGETSRQEEPHQEIKSQVELPQQPPSRSQTHPVHPERPALGRRSSSSASRMSPKSTRLEMLSKELPLKLMDSIDNENKLLFSKGPDDESGLLLRMKHNNGSGNIYDVDLDGRSGSTSNEGGRVSTKGGSSRSNTGNSKRSGSSHNNSIQDLVEEDEEDSEDDENEENEEGVEQGGDEGERRAGEGNGGDENESNIIADGIMGNKLKLLRGKDWKRTPSGQAANGARGLLFNEDGFVDDRLIQLKVQANGVLNHTDNDWDDDNLNYHARGW